ncbi:hypothetical protein HPP92_006554 [Vanilla planifolia]|uniref:Late embryogenesis abundant protein LEA-2 subgroup domain-containing protein n=1 Tax=Vanilla planifolia TaxID=51239 RepID=A0A835RIL3_VANPL|nr:hypothetical protein HPP92_006554 [Vanilla planifolia]
MAESKDASFDLNQPYYGPPIPPTKPPSTLPPSDRSRGRESFNFYKLLCFSFKVFTLFLIFVGIIVLALWLIYQPLSIKVYANDASLLRFNLSSTGEKLAHNLTVELSFRNPNRKYSIYYERMDAQAWYAGGIQQIGSVGFPQLYQERKSTIPVRLGIEGESAVAAGNMEQVRQSYNREKGEGFFYVRVKIYATVRLKMIVVKSVKFKPDLDCFLRIPALFNATSTAAGFHPTECDVNNFS